MKRIIALIISACALLTLFSCSGKKVYEEKEKSFTSNGITIKLTEAFSEISQEGYTAVYDSSEAAVFLLKENFTSFKNEDMSLEKYAGFVLESNKDKAPTPISVEHGFSSFEYSFKNEETGKTYKYLTALFEGSDAYWCVQFTCESEKYEEYKPYFISWAKTVAFAPKEASVLALA